MPVEISGLDELIQQLTDAPDHIRIEGMGIVREATEATAREIAATYPKGPTGNLQKRVKTIYPAEALLVGIVQSTAPHSHLWEWGTKERKTKAGANRGRMPAHKDHSQKVTPSIAEKHRARMYQGLREMLTRMGFEVSGD
jgi:hypothetical protein